MAVVGFHLQHGVYVIHGSCAHWAVLILRNAPPASNRYLCCAYYKAKPPMYSVYLDGRTYRCQEKKVISTCACSGTLASFYFISHDLKIANLWFLCHKWRVVRMVLCTS